ncbi:MAG: hypothetical protein QNL68_10930 [Akkermansiaceae bacterium]|jgi:hypothetical protein
MICLLGNLPVLQIGNHQVVGYDTAGIDEALVRAAAMSDRQDFPFIDDIRAGILHYLEHRCSLRLLPIEDLYARMRSMLIRLGCDAIAQNLKILSPPVTISLVRAAHKARNGCELFFFSQLSEEIEQLQGNGVESIRFCDIAESAKILRGCKSKTKACSQLMSEIVDFLEQYRVGSTTLERQITLIPIL